MNRYFTECDISSLPTQIIEDESFDFSLFENKPAPFCDGFDLDTIELLHLDKFATAG